MKKAEPMDWCDIPLLVSCTNGGGLVLLHHDHVMVLERRDHTGLSISGGRWARAIVGHPSCDLEWWGEEGAAPRRIRLTPSVDDIHDVMWHGDEMLVVSTGSNEILRLATDGSLLDCRHFPGEGDAWHLNCLALWDERVVASAFGEFANHRGYKGLTRETGFVFDLDNGERIWQGLSQPHSPLQVEDTFYVCDSETKRVLWRKGDKEGGISFDAYTRGLAVVGEYLFVGLSLSRNVEAGKRENGSIAVLRRKDHRVVGTLPLPFREVYAIVPLSPYEGREWPRLLQIASTERDERLEALLDCQEDLRLARTAVVALDRLARHPIVGPLVGLLRLIKQDPTFGRKENH